LRPYAEGQGASRNGNRARKKRSNWYGFYTGPDTAPLLPHSSLVLGQSGTPILERFRIAGDSGVIVWWLTLTSYWKRYILT
jgi:hypothetical protein